MPSEIVRSSGTLLKSTGLRTSWILAPADLQHTWAHPPYPLIPTLGNGVIRSKLTDYLGKARSVHKESYPSEPLLLLACVASLWHAWVGRRSLWSRLLQDQQLPFCRRLGLESTLKATYPNLSMLLFSLPLTSTYTMFLLYFETSFIFPT
jgi:hypothetical protein